ncbi:hypothetical protein T4D_2768 [Trichinella pseudospiralis]|uniref:Uncharacterized protein n=1 Tax=Trichinella pseudospiralis TaxID=6337 RepID=A0A0V1FHC2_TRIPS|nr:hypothetical protein T4D_2768 [Trichinella pseudospiralis]
MMLSNVCPASLAKDQLTFCDFQVLYERTSLEKLNPFNSDHLLYNHQPTLPFTMNRIPAPQYSRRSSNAAGIIDQANKLLLYAYSKECASASFQPTANCYTLA